MRKLDYKKMNERLWITNCQILCVPLVVGQLNLNHAITHMRRNQEGWMRKDLNAYVRFAQSCVCRAPLTTKPLATNRKQAANRQSFVHSLFVLGEAGLIVRAS